MKTFRAKPGYFWDVILWNMQKLVSFFKIKKLWKTNKNPVQIYIHSAFCKSICKYCCYRGTTLTEKNKNLYHKYFYKYLPKQINRYKKIINSQYINSIYFGGGTPNTEENLENLVPAFEKLRDVKCNEKIIELHTGLPITDRTIDVLKKEHFTTVILCQQTFDKEKLKLENRTDIANNDLDSIIGKLHGAGINVGMDFIVFGDGPGRIDTDMDTVLGWRNRPDEITVALSFFENLSFSNIKDASSKLLQNGYTIPLLYENPDVYIKRKPFRFVLKNKFNLFYNTFYSFIPYLVEKSSFENFDTGVLGIGSLPGMVKQTFSRVQNTTYSETWDGKKVRYTLYRPLSYKKRLENVLKSLPDCLPVGTQIFIEQSQDPYNRCKIEVSSPIQIDIKFPPRFPSKLLNAVRGNFVKETQEKLDGTGPAKVILNEWEAFDSRCLQ